MFGEVCFGIMLAFVGVGCAVPSFKETWPYPPNSSYVEKLITYIHKDLMLQIKWVMMLSM